MQVAFVSEALPSFGLGGTLGSSWVAQQTGPGWKEVFWGRVAVGTVGDQCLQAGWAEAGLCPPPTACAAAGPSQELPGHGRRQGWGAGRPRGRWRQRGAREAQPSAGSPVTPSARRALTPAGGLARPPAAGAARPCPSRCPRRCRTTSASSRTCSRPPCTRARGECGLRGGAASAPGRCRLHAESAPPSTGQPGRPDGWQLCGSCQCHVSSYKTVLILANFNRQK